MREVTASDAGYHANETTAVNNEEYGVDLQQAMENFANATTADREAFQQLTKTNVMLEEQLSTLFQQNMNLAQQINQRPQYVAPLSSMNQQP